MKDDQNNEIVREQMKRIGEQILKKNILTKN